MPPVTTKRPLKTAGKLAKTTILPTLKAAPGKAPRAPAVKIAPKRPPRVAPAPAVAAPLETRQLILHEAARLLREHGYAAVSLRQIAKNANIKAGSIYYHFESKEELLFQVLDEGLRVIVQEVNAAVASLPAHTPFRERLKVVVRGHLHGLLRMGNFSSANIRIYGQVPDEVRRRHYVARREFADWWDNFFAQAVAEGALRADLNPSLVRVFIVGALNFTVEWFDPKHGSFDKLAEQIYVIIADGLLLK